MAKSKKTKKTKKTQKVAKSNPVLVAILLVVLAISIGLLWYVNSQDVYKTRKAEQKPIETIQEKDLPSHEEAELTGFGFMQDLLEVAPPSSDEEAMERMYNTLSSSAKEQFSFEEFQQEIPLFVGIQDIPDAGISVEDLQVKDDENAYLIVGLNYASGRVLKKINLVVEEKEWKVDSVEDYEKEESMGGPAVDAVITFVMEETEVEKGDLIIISATEKEWPDGCLGLAEEDEMCTMALVHGYEIVLEVEGETRTFRTDMEGTLIREEVL